MIKFIHTPKTGGTSIEDTAIEHGIRWGRFEPYQPTVKQWGGVATWHYPLDWYPESEREKWQDQTLFTVVRHPVKKLVSAYGCDWWNYNKSYLTDTKDQFNLNILKEVVNEINGKNIRSIQQWRYVMINGKQVTDSVLKLENLGDEFEQFAEHHNLPFTELKHSNPRTSKRWTEKDLDQEVLDLIYKVYDMDFQLFGYEKKI